MGNSRITIRDVAGQAGVSVATVSKVLNDRYGVAPATAERVRSVIEDLGFESSLVARSLRSRQTKVIGVLVWAIEPFSAEILKGVAHTLGHTGYELVVYSAGGSGTERLGWEKRSLSRLSGTLIDAAVMVTPTVVDGGFGIPVASIDPHVGSPTVPSVTAENREGAVCATQHLLHLGHQRIAFLGRPARDLESSAEREAGYREAMSEARIEVTDDLIVPGEYDADATRAAIHHVLASADRPSALFAANDMSAVLTMEVARELGIDVPNQLSVVGFDNVPESALAAPALTTVAQPMQEMGERAIEMVLDLLAGREPTQFHVRLPTQLIERSSTAPPRR